MDMSKQKTVPSLVELERKILLIRHKRVMIDRDLAVLYGISTKRLNEQVKRNKARFPESFMFQLTENEKNEVVANCDHLIALNYSSFLPYVFTEHGVLMLANVLSSTKAIEMSVKIVEVFIRMRQMLSANSELSNRLKQLEDRVGKHDEDIQSIIAAIQQLIIQEEKPKRRMGFHHD